jgi:hypothetical protein
MRMNLGCGPKAALGWLNGDLRPAPGVDLLLDLGRAVPSHPAASNASPHFVAATR